MSIAAVSWALERTDLPPVDRMVLTVYAYHSNEAGENAWPSVGTVARESGAAESTVREARKRLVAGGYLEETGAEEHRCPVFRLPMRSDPPAPGPSESRTLREPDPPAPVAGPSESRTLTVNEPSEEKRISNEIPKAVEIVFDYWRSTFSLNGRTRLTDGRRNKIRARLKSYTVDDLKLAIDGCRGSTFHVENGHIDLELICRSDTKTEEFIRRAKAAGGHLTANRQQWADKFGRKEEPSQPRQQTLS